jgi:hypothetical protein
MLINKRTGQGVFGQPNGSYSIYVSQGDTVVLSVKDYIPQVVVVLADSNCQCKRKLVIEPRPKEIREEREALAMRETRMVTGIEVLKSPITALYQAFSRKEQNKRWIAEQQYKDDQRKVVKELLRLYISYDIINLSEEDFDDFIAFLNVSDSFLKTATEMELITFIKDKFEHFQLVKNK